MNTQLDPRVKAVFDHIVAHSPDIGPTPSGDAVHRMPTAKRGSRPWLAVAAALIVVVGVGALISVQGRTGDPPAVTSTPTAHSADSTITTPEHLNVIGDQLAGALGLDARVLVVNASANPGLAESLRDALTLSGYRTVQAVDSANGTVLDQSTIYTKPSAPASIPNVLGPVLGTLWEAAPPPSAVVAADMGENADAVVVVGNDLADAPWQDIPAPLIDLGIGRLVIVDAAANDPRRSQQVDAQAEALRRAGVDVFGVVLGSRTVEQTRLMPIRGQTAWTFAIAELAGVGGFDQWSPDLINEPLPDNVNAALVVGVK